MKSKLNVYVVAPNVSRLRSRVENPDKDLTAQVRKIIADSAIAVLNRSHKEMRAEIASRVSALNLKYKNANHKLQVESVMSSIFDTFFADSSAALSDVEDSDESQNDASETPNAETPEGEPNAETPADDFAE